MLPSKLFKYKFFIYLLLFEKMGFGHIRYRSPLDVDVSCDKEPHARGGYCFFHIFYILLLHFWNNRNFDANFRKNP